MAMLFRTIKASIVNILGAAEAGRYQTVGFQRQKRSAAEILDTLRTVQVYYGSGNFPLPGGAMCGPTIHEITYQVELAVSTGAAGDLATINNPASEQSAIAAAILAFQEAAQRADEAYDEFVDIVYQILMDPVNFDMGLAKGVVANRWVPNITKDAPIKQGEFVVLTGNIALTLRTSEELNSETGTPATDILTVLDIDGDDTEKTEIAATTEITP